MSQLKVSTITDEAGTGAPTFTMQAKADFYLSPTTITTSYVVPSGFNAMTAGPIEIDTGVEVEVSTDSTWTVV